MIKHGLFTTNRWEPPSIFMLPYTLCLACFAASTSLNKFSTNASNFSQEIYWYNSYIICVLSFTLNYLPIVVSSFKCPIWAWHPLLDYLIESNFSAHSLASRAHKAYMKFPGHEADKSVILPPPSMKWVIPSPDNLQAKVVAPISKRVVYRTKCELVFSSINHQATDGGLELTTFQAEGTSIQVGYCSSFYLSPSPTRHILMRHSAWLVFKIVIIMTKILHI